VAPLQEEHPAKELFVEHCADCHGSDGRGLDYRQGGVDIPDFTSKRWVAIQSPTKLRLGILLGKGDEMPSFEGELSRHQARALVRFIRSIAGLHDAQSEPGGPALSEQLSEFHGTWELLTQQWELEFTRLELLQRRRRTQ
jgi:mono/diheme cytochrome c family protein